MLLSLPSDQQGQFAAAITIYAIGYLGFRALANEASAIFEAQSMWRRLPIFLAEAFSVAGQLILLGAVLKLLTTSRGDKQPDTAPDWASG